MNGKVEAKGNLYLHSEFWKEITKIATSPSLFARLSQALEKIRELYWYDIREYKLDNARTNQKITEFPSVGNLVFVISIPLYHWGEFNWEERNWVANPPTIKFNSPNAPALDLSVYEAISYKFESLYLTNEAEVGQELKLLLARGVYELTKESPKFNLET